MLSRYILKPDICIKQRTSTAEHISKRALLNVIRAQRAPHHILIISAHMKLLTSSRLLCKREDCAGLIVSSASALISCVGEKDETVKINNTHAGEYAERAN